jgi:uncharacterized protein YtpQ (UPF0354 family)
MSVLNKWFPKKVPTREEFAALVMKRLSQSGVQNVVYEREHFVLKLEGNNLIILDNGHANYCKADKREREAILVRLCSIGSPKSEIPADFNSARPSLMPVIRHAAYASLVELDLRAKNVDVSKLESPTKPLFGSLVLGLAYDTEHSIQQINKTTFERWGVSFEEALKEATDNLREKTNPNGMKEEAPGIYRSQWADSYDCVRILMTDLIYRLAVAGEPIAFIPNRNQLWVTGNRNAQGISLLLEIGQEAHFEPYSVSPDLFMLSDGVWRVYVPEDRAVRDSLLSLQQRREAVDYQQQKQALELIHKTQGIDIFVASYSIFERKDGSRYSSCLWANGVDSLLPKAQYIRFGVDKDTKDYILLPWESALAVAGDLMEEQAGYIPKRYRVRFFPNKEQIERLRKLE